MHNWYKSRQNTQLIQIKTACTIDTNHTTVCTTDTNKGSMNNGYKSRQHAQRIQIKTECTVIFTRTQAGHPAWVVQWHTKSWRQPAQTFQTWDMPYTITTTVQVKSCREIRKFSEPTILPSPNNIILKFRDEQPNLVDTFEIWKMTAFCGFWSHDCDSAAQSSRWHSELESRQPSQITSSNSLSISKQVFPQDL